MRLLTGAAASAALALTIAACSSDAASTSTDAAAATLVPATAGATPSVAVGATPTSIMPGVVTDTTLDPTTVTSAAGAINGDDAVTTVPVSTAAIDGAALLQAAMDATAVGYHYHAIATIAGAVAVEVDGDRVGDGTRLGVVRDGVAVQYVITPDGTWVQPDGGDWDQLDTPPATSDPILALRAPSALSVDSVDGNSVHLTVSVPATSLGLGGDAVVPVAVVITAGTLSEVVYSTTIEGQPASIDTVVGPALDPSPVVAPI